MRTKEEVIKELNNMKIKGNSNVNDNQNGLEIVLIVLAGLGLLFYLFK